jgi:nucleotide-binding universal stress UspA family protein
MRRILVAVDGTRASSGASHLALEYAARLGARVTFLHVLPEQAGDAPDFAAFESACRTYAEQLVGEAAKRGGASGPSTATAVEYGDPVEVLLGAAKAEDVDLVVIGTRDRGPLARTLLGSVSAALIARSPKPVMVVPERLSPAEPSPAH